MNRLSFLLALWIGAGSLGSILASEINGLSGIYEFAYFGAYPPQPFLDSDGDGVSDVEEMIWGTNPTNSESRVLGPSATLAHGELRLTWPTAPFRTYELQAGDDLESWQTVAAGAISNFVDRVPDPAGTGRRFYRVTASLRRPSAQSVRLSSTRSGNDFVVNWPTTANHQYELQVSDNLKAWRTISANATPPYSEQIGKSAVGQRFFRVKPSQDPADSNGNGVADWEEALYQQVTGHVLRPTDDSDGDGLPDLQEFQQGYQAAKKDHPAVGLIVFTPLEK